MPSQIPVPGRRGVMKWALRNPDAPAKAVDAVNKLIALDVVIVNAGRSSLQIAGQGAVLTISTKDIRIGPITGSKGSNAALTSLLSALGQVFQVTNQTT